MQNGRASYRLYIGTCYNINIIVPATALQLHVCVYCNSFNRRPDRKARAHITITYGSDQTAAPPPGTKIMCPGWLTLYARYESSHACGIIRYNYYYIRVVYTAVEWIGFGFRYFGVNYYCFILCFDPRIWRMIRKNDARRARLYSFSCKTLFPACRKWKNSS